MAENKGRTQWGESEDSWEVDEDVDAHKHKFLTFQIAEEEFAISIGM